MRSESSILLEQRRDPSPEAPPHPSPREGRKTATEGASARTGGMEDDRGRAPGPALPGESTGLLLTAAGDLVARAFQDALRLQELLRTRAARAVALGVFVLLVFMDARLPGAGAEILFGTLLCLSAAAFLLIGEALVDQAWRRPEERMSVQRSIRRSPVSLPVAGAFLLCALPFFLGGWAGMTWFLVLSAPCTMMAIIWLMAGRLAPLVEGFPFVCPPCRGDLAGVALAALLALFGGATAAMTLTLGPGLRLMGLPLALVTWIFVSRCGGLLARRHFLRVAAR